MKLKKQLKKKLIEKNEFRKQINMHLIFINLKEEEHNKKQSNLSSTTLDINCGARTKAKVDNKKRKIVMKVKMLLMKVGN